MRIGSLCSGYGGLDLGVIDAIGGEVAWHVEYEAAPSKILKHHWPFIPNYGDLTVLDWSTLPPIDVLTAGYPCQPFSIAGKRKGAEDERHLWPYIKDAVRVLRPRLVVLENVRGHLTLGFGRVIGDLAELGYVARWVCVRAADAGAPHGRARVFIVAYPEGQPWRIGHGNDVRVGSGKVRREPDTGRSVDAHSADNGHERSGSAWHGRGRPKDGYQPLADAGSGESERRRVNFGVAFPSGGSESATGERQRDGDAVDDRGSTDWREYADAIRRWEHVLGRVAPAPTNPDGRGGSHRLSARFVEWMMGLPEGHVTEVGLTRAQQLKALGNGVVPQQAALALRTLLEGESL